MTVTAAPTETVYALVAANLGPFATVWPYEDADDVTAWLLKVDAAPQALANPADFTLVGPSPLTAGGNITLSASLLTLGAWPTGARLALVRATPGDQPSALGEAMGFSPTAYEAALDHLERQVQEARATLARALALPFGVTPAVIGGATERASTVFGFDDAGAPVLLSYPGVVVAANFTPLPAAPANPQPGWAYFDTVLGYPLVYGSDAQWHGLVLST